MAGRPAARHCRWRRRAPDEARMLAGGPDLVSVRPGCRNTSSAAQERRRGRACCAAAWPALLGRRFGSPPTARGSAERRRGGAGRVTRRGGGSAPRREGGQAALGGTRRRRRPGHGEGGVRGASTAGRSSRRLLHGRAGRRFHGGHRQVARWAGAAPVAMAVARWGAASSPPSSPRLARRAAVRARQVTDTPVRWARGGSLTAPHGGGQVVAEILFDASAQLESVAALHGIARCRRGCRSPPWPSATWPAVPTGSGAGSTRLKRSEPRGHA